MTETTRFHRVNPGDLLDGHTIYFVDDRKLLKQKIQFFLVSICFHHPY